MDWLPYWILFCPFVWFDIYIYDYSDRYILHNVDVHHILYKLHLPCTPLCTYEFLHVLSYNYVLFVLISICTTHIQARCFGDLLYPFKFNNWNTGCFFHGIITSPLLTQDISLLFWFGQAHCCWHLDWANGNHETMVRTWWEATYPLPSRVFQKRWRGFF